MKDKEMSGRERRALALLDAYEYMLTRDGVTLEARLRTIPNGWRDFQCLRAIAKRLVKGIETTCGEQDMKVLNRYRGGEIVVRERTIVDHHPVSVDRLVLRALTNEVIKTACQYCVNTDAEVRGCKLRKLLMTVDPLEEIPSFGCGYPRRLEEEP